MKKVFRQQARLVGPERAMGAGAAATRELLPCRPAGRLHSCARLDHALLVGSAGDGPTGHLRARAHWPPIASCSRTLWHSLGRRLALIDWPG